MDGFAVASTALPSSSTTVYVSWEEVNVLSDKGRREVHYYLKRRDGVSDLAVIGREKSLRHMSYHFSIKNCSLFFSSTSFYKLKSRREVVYWLNSVVSDSPYRGSHCSVDGIWSGKNVKSMEFGAVKDIQSQKLVQYSKEFLWLEILNEAKSTQLEPFACCKQFENDDIKPFDVSQLKGYWKQDILRNMYSLAPFNDSAYRQHRADEQKTVWDVDDSVGIRPRKRYRQLKDDDVVNLHFSGNRESMETSRADLQDAQNSKKENESFNVQVDEAKQYSSLHLILGSQLEVLAQDSGLRGCWFRAHIIKKHKNKVKVQYRDIQDAADEASKLEEWILASKVASPDEVGVRISGRTTIRPPSQYTKGSVSCINVGSVVDVWWHDGWWEGLVVHKDSEEKLCVHFPGEKRESVFDICDIRQSQEWVGNRWINMKERCDLVGIVLRAGKQNASNANDSLDKNTICFYGGQIIKDSSDRNDSPGESGNDSAKDECLVPDLSKDDWLSQLKWKSSGKRKRVTSTHVRKLNCSRNLVKSTARSVSSEPFLIPASLKVDNDNCKYIGDPLFSSSVVPPLTNFVMTR
ncbi:Aproteint domain-containing protein / bromo-adjacent domain-containing protein, putative isoform 2 [Hibiscus syriacus]|uniref:Aproteint domain-containing protein / bromo-adjacent domain-containing protein, putative isoform 2 n=1 Tax=Hibiscus syriacus TaxID=106335 RepID=A0A6A2WWD4_HIBSY|nr:Aproteint domain-containing protein / bromo-adjacent domain-containing protein, putative isoform 2 [Hibiscus syriacus]